MSEDKNSPVGGYFELELPPMGPLPYAGAERFQSARAAFLALLRSGECKKVWMPRFICNAMLAPLEKADIEIAWYDLTDDLEVEPCVRLGAEDWLLYVNYFGVCGGRVDALLNRFPPTQIVLDYSQAFFSPPNKRALATIYSPRKFFGVPDGGLLYSNIPIVTPRERDESSFARIEHLMLRLGDSPTAGYAAYRQAEESLSNIEPIAMSRLSERILSSIDFESVSRRRKENFLTLDNLLGGEMAGITATDTPLCYPYKTRDVRLRQRLIESQVFVPTYWNDALDRLDAGQAENLVRNILPLPVDQRYGSADMERVSAIILGNE